MVTSPDWATPTGCLDADLPPSFTLPHWSSIFWFLFPDRNATLCPKARSRCNSCRASCKPPAGKKESATAHIQTGYRSIWRSRERKPFAFTMSTTLHFLCFCQLIFTGSVTNSSIRREPRSLGRADKALVTLQFNCKESRSQNFPTRCSSDSLSPPLLSKLL